MLKKSVLQVVLKNTIVVFFTILLATQCHNKSNVSYNGTKNPSRLVIEPVWTKLADNSGSVDLEMDRAAAESAEISFNDKFIVSTGRLGKNLKVWDLATGKIVFETVCPGELKIAVFSPDSKFLLAGGEFNQVLIWQVDNWLPYKTIDFEASVEGMRFSYNGKFLAVGDEAGIITIIETKEFEKIKTVLHRDNETKYEAVPRSDVNSIDFTPEDDYLVSGCIDGTIKIWYFPDMNLIKTLESGTSSVKSVRVSRKGNCIASATCASEWGNENAVKIWDFKSGELLHMLTFPDGVEAVEFTPDGNFLLCGGGGRVEDNAKTTEGYIYIYYIPENFLTDAIKQVFRKDVFRLEYLNLNKSGDKLVSAHEDGTVRLWNIVEKY